MQLPADIRVQQQLRRWSKYLITGMMIIAVLILLSWLLNVDFLRRPFSEQVVMNPVSALCFIISGISLWLFSSNTYSKVAVVSAYIVLLIGLIKLGELSLGYDLKIDELLFSDKMIAGKNGLTNEMSLNTALCFVLAGISLVLYKEENTNKKSSHYLVLVMMLIGLLSLLVHLYRVHDFSGFFTYIPMATLSAICVVLFALSLLFTEPAKGIMTEFTSLFSGSLMARLLIPAAIIIPAVLALLRLFGTWEGLYNYEFGVALYVLSIIIIFLAITWYNARLLNRRDFLKKQTEDALRSSEQNIQAIFNNAPDAVVVIDSTGNITRWNPESEKLFGWRAEEVRGRALSELIVPVQYREQHKKGLERFLQTGESRVMGRTIDLKAIKNDLSEIDVSVRISPLQTGEQYYFIGFIRDITEQKQMENKLKSFNEELSRNVEEKTAEIKEIFERITDGFVALDKDFHYTYINKKAGNLIRQNPSELMGKNMWQLFPQLIGTDTYKAFHEAMETQQYTSNTDYFEDLGVWLENYIYPSPNGLSIFIRDISEQKKSESEIVKAKELADKLIDSLPGVFYFFDANGKFIRWNKQLEEVTGYSSEEIEVMHPVDFFEGEEKKYIAERIAGVFEYGVNDADANFFTKDGRKIPFYFKAVLINYEGKPCLLGNGIDITQRKKYEAELIASEQKYKLLFEGNPLPMWMLSLPDYKIFDVNNVALQQYGYEREEFLRLSINDFRPSEDYEKLKAATNTNFRGLHYAGIWRHKRKNGSIIYVDVVTHDIYYKGLPARLVLANDVTEKYIAEEKLKESYDAIRTLTEHIQNAREEERLHIAREIHDELGQLLTVLKMDVSWLKKRIEPENQPAKEKSDDILSLIDSTVKTVRRMASELRPSLLDDLGLQPAMEWYLEEFEKRSGIIKESHISDDTELQVPDSLKIGLFRIFQESLTNVARHSFAKNVYVSLVQKDKQLILTIRDNGTGFEEKSQGTRRTLGLLGMKERAVMMGGTYNISGKKGEGTTVSVVVPLP